jgi:hypothetical protein
LGAQPALSAKRSLRDSTELLRESPVTFRVISPSTSDAATQTASHAPSAAASPVSTANASATGSSETSRPSNPSSRSIVPYWPALAPTSTTTSTSSSSRSRAAVSERSGVYWRTS